MTTTGSKPVVDFCADYETYYDAEYSLSKITTLEYVRSPRFELHMMSWKCPALGVHKPRRAIGDRMIQEVFDMLKGASQYVDFRLVGANSGTFDAFIADYHNGFRFMHHFDVSLMARWVLGNTLKDCKLETIATRLDIESSQELRKEAFDALGMADDGLGKKISIALSAVKGLHIHEINPQLMVAYAAYCDLDVELTWGVYQELVKNSDPFAIYIQELYINAFLDFPVEIDTDLLSTLKDDYIEQRAEEVAAFGDCLDSGTSWEGLKSIRSKDKFAALLVSLGVPQESLPLKQGKNGLIYAFSKSDMALDTLAAQYEAEDSLVPEACRLRLEYNSSMAEGKMNKFLAAGLTGPWAFNVKPASAPNTGRHSGGSSSGSSGHNLKRAKPTLDTSCKMGIRLREDVGLRDVISAKPGEELCVSDLAGIEMRVSLTFCKDFKYMEILRDPTRDVYCETATDIFERPVTKKDKAERFVGKIAELALAYGTGWKKLHHTARLWGNPITVELAQLTHAMYRRSHPPVVDMWDMLEEIMFMLADGGKFSQVLNPMYVDEAGIHSPNGFLLRYPGIRYDRKSRRFTYYNAARRSVVSVHRGLILENVSQNLATAVFNDIHARAHARIVDQFPTAKFVTSVHDELLYASKEGDGASVLAIVLQEMEVPPVWWPELPIRGEGDFGFGLIETNDWFNKVSRYGMLK